MSDLSRGIGGSVIELSVEDEPPANARADRNRYDISRALSRTTPPLAKRRAVCVVVESCWKLDAIRDLIAEWKIAPSEIRRDDHDTARPVQRAWRSNADTQKVASLCACRSARLGDDFLHERCEAIDDRRRAFLGVSRRHLHRDFSRAVNRHRASRDVGTAEVDS